MSRLLELLFAAPKPMLALLIVCMTLAYVGQAYAQIDYFLPETEDLFGLWNGDNDWGDFDNDNDLDLLETGYGLGGQTGEGFMKFYQNNGNSTFTLYPNTMIGSGNGSCKFADLDGDNDLDVFVCGQTLFGVDSTRVYANIAGNFTDLGYPFSSRVSSSVSFGDYDCDGDLDILVTGGTIDDASDAYTEIYRNEGGFNFTQIAPGLTGVRNGDACFGDYNGDGWPDIALTGRAESGIYITKLYKGSSTGTFTEVAVDFYGLRYSRIAFVDYDCDGDLDVILSGSFVNESASLFKLYRNDGLDTFTEVVQPAVMGERQGDMVYGDINNDGYADIILNGLITNTTTVANVYLYDPSSGLYVDSQQMIYLKYAAMALGDYNNDSKLDLSLHGHYEYQNYWNDLYYNAYTAVNTAPTAPTNLNEVVLDNSVILAWDTASDTQTPTPGLTYNLRLGTTPGGNEIMSAMSNEQGWRKVARPGNTGHNSFYQIYNLPDGHYYWSVQSIDQGFVGSAFSAPRSFYIGVANDDQLTPTISSVIAQPNPFHSNTSISFALNRPEPATVSIYNLKGQLVRTLNSGNLPSGKHDFAWNGLNQQGEALPNGIYFLNIHTSNQNITHKLTLIK